MNILLVITGSIYCTLFWKIQEELEKENNIKVLFTKNAQIIADKELEYFFMEREKAIYTHGNNPKYNDLSGNGYKYACDINGKYHKYSCSFPVYYYSNEKLMCDGGLEYEQYVYEETGNIEHIELCNWADKVVIAPCTANTLNKIYQGIADNFIMTTILSFLGTSKTTYIAPAMNVDMWNNFAVKRSINELKQFNNIKILYPTVEKSEYGNYGVGALANIKDMVNIINGHTWLLPFKNYDALNNECYNDIDWKEYLPKNYEQGSFGFINQNNINTGIDIYCKNNPCVYAVEDGEIIDVYKFTEKDSENQSLNKTYAVSIKGKSGVISYGKIIPDCDIYKGRFVTAKTCIGSVASVLPKNKIENGIRNYNNEMLHIELYKNFEDGINLTWKLNENRPENLLDPTVYLYNIKESL